MTKTAEIPAAAWAALGYTPCEWQYKNVHERTERFIAGCTCRQCGKTTAMAGEIHRAMTEPRDPETGDPPLVGVMAVDYERADLPVMRWYEWYATAFGVDSLNINLNKHVIRLPTGATCRWFSSENPLGAAGYTYSRFMFDESQWIKNVAWVKTRPAFNARQAGVLACGTPDVVEDSSWFRGLILRGQDEAELDHYSFGISVFENPYITYDEIVAMRADMTDDEFRMLALGQWVDTSGTVFHRFEHCFTGAYEAAPTAAGVYVMGLDVAKRQDYTVGYVMDMTRNAVVHKFRFNGLPYDEVEDRVKAVSKHYGCLYVHMDATGVGDALADFLMRSGIAVRGFVFGSKSKHRLISNLNRMLEHGELKLPEEDIQLKRELSVFKSKLTTSGNVVYACPDTYFDDSIDALGLAALQARHIGTGGLRQRDWIEPVGVNADAYANTGWDKLKERSYAAAVR